MKKLISILVAFAMMAMLAVTSAFAAKDPNAQVSTNETDVNASVKKTLVVPEGTTVDDLSYSLTFTNTAKPGETAPNLSAVFNTFENATDTDNNPGTKTFTIQLDNILPAGTTWPDTGYYEYSVAEEMPATATEATQYKDTATVGNYDITTQYSAAQYVLKVGIATKADGSKYIASASVAKTQNDDGTKANGNKVPISADGTQFGFNNTIVSKTIDDIIPGGENDDDALSISKRVVVSVPGENEGDPATETDYATSQKFSFTLSMNKPALATDEEDYDYEILDAAGRVKENAGGTVRTGEDAEFQLGAGEKLVFTNISIGASYTVNEAKYPQYTTTDNMGTTVVYIADDGNTKGFKNIYDESKDPETGLSIANLPFIVLALVAVGGLVAYVIVRRKSEDNA